jgi:hypothetical protein
MNSELQYVDHTGFAVRLNSNSSRSSGGNFDCEVPLYYVFATTYLNLREMTVVVDTGNWLTMGHTTGVRLPPDAEAHQSTIKCMQQAFSLRTIHRRMNLCESPFPAMTGANWTLSVE